LLKWSILYRRVPVNVLDQDARVPRFGGLGFQVALLAPLRRGFFTGESRPIFL
jgi:hypothetical protein